MHVDSISPCKYISACCVVWLVGHIPRNGKPHANKRTAGNKKKIWELLQDTCVRSSTSCLVRQPSTRERQLNTPSFNSYRDIHSPVLVVYLPTAGFSTSSSEKVPCHKSSSHLHKGHKWCKSIWFPASSHHTQNQRGVPVRREKTLILGRLFQHFIFCMLR